MYNKTILIFFITVSSIYSQAQQISLAGKWQVKLDSNNQGRARSWFKGFSGQSIQLPGTLDDAKMGKPTLQDTANVNKQVLLSLTRKHRYIGVAWYNKEINVKSDLNNASISLERVIWKTECWIDGIYRGSAESLSAPQKFAIGSLKAGKHLVVLKIDNTKQHDISFNDFAHAYTDGTQIIWNGVIGKITLLGRQENTIQDFQIYPEASQKRIKFRFLVNNLAGPYKTRYEIYKNGKLINTKILSEEKAASGVVNGELHLREVELWDEFDPNLYMIKVQLLDRQSHSIARTSSAFGFRKFGNRNGALMLNGRRIFLRGTLDCNIYPIQGHPPMDKQGWRKVFSAVKNYGLNHVRYHSWCPPEAAFQVADSLGLYLQVELPLWSLNVGRSESMLRFLEDECQRIITAYGNHPSFCFWSMGNELEGDFNWLNNLVASLKTQDPRRFYTATTFSFQRGHGLLPEPNDDIFITQYTRKGWIRGQGIFNNEIPNFDRDYQKNADSLKVPLIAHEVGQYSVYPNLKEIEKYTGVLEPLNFKTIRHDLQKKKLFVLADSFKLASGKFAALLYKEEIERALKTNALSGYQLLDLHDFPGQGTALVGLLDAFWDSKGLITPKAFRAFSSPVVPLLRYEKASYLNDQRFNAEVQVANFGKNAFLGEISWKISDQYGKIIKEGQIHKQQIVLGTSTLGTLSIELNSISKPSELTFKMSIVGTDYQNSWNFWVYPKSLPREKKTVLFTTSKTDAYTALAVGSTVIFNPDTSKIVGVPGRFTSVFWSPVHFPDQPGSMGLLCNPLHPAFKSFPTSFFSNWQWWDLITKSKSIIIPNAEGSPNPIVRIIDNFYKNRSMGTLFEAKVGKGKLILCTMDLSSQLEQRIEARQLRSSILSYAESEDFNPKNELSFNDIDQWLK